MHLENRTSGANPHAKTITLGIALAMTALASGHASASVIPWRNGMSRMIGFGHCAKGPCMKRYDYSPSVRHVHVEHGGQKLIVICSGLSRQPMACRSPSLGSQ